MNKLVFNRASFEFHDAIVDWCQNQFGTGLGRGRRWFIGDRLHGYLVLYFIDDADYLLTVERWK